MRIETPLGPMEAAFDPNGALTELRFGAERSGRNEAGNPAVARQLAEYFAGTRTTFELPLAPRGSEFQMRVWAELMRVPFNGTISYAELARRIGSAGAARAVGRANATNPIAIIVPCHRVVGSDGSLTGYAYGVDVKRRLLDFENGRISF